MAEFTGSALYLAFKGTALHADFRSFEPAEEVGLVDASAGADVARTYLKTLEDGRASLLLLYQTGGTAAAAPWNLMAQGAEGTLEWGPEGTATNKPRYYVNAIAMSRSRKIPFDNVIEDSFEFQYSGVVTETAY